MEDIIMTIPSYCDDCETWHQYHIWAYDDGTYSQSDSDGDHEPLEESDVPDQEEYDRLWKQYSQWVVDQGEDPLGNYYVKYSTKVKERWRLKLAKTLAGPRLIGARRAGRSYELTELPEHVRSFLALDASGKLGDFATWEALLEVLPDIKSNKWFVAHIEEDRPRSGSTVAREVRSAARKHLRAAHGAVK